MKWSELNSPQQVEQILEESKNKRVLIFKHSTSCSVSRMALDRLERNWKDDEMDMKPYFLDLISFRAISNRIAEQFQVEHESPQVLIIENGEAVYDRSHMAIDYRAIRDAIKS
ncbi:bacillithiol system redox-active protein YtxJ [Chryseolinea lacunae]|uniref:Bacillithiol system redox-active protein YtxJ n=1 Tax=Chryseolinea lacunae TaxID=2801331 RepID=A0ABS1KQM4_9BACT|nr:bacillithiol system redox-active protein YtxJ [Chryseolinea lacunae]MBL0741542.1 bacillithiol system redox-active protein YtxJ [Chryseolinea lacunae]